MIPQTRADQAFESWLVDGPTRMPEHLVDSIVTQLEDTHQRKHLWLPGREQMNRMLVAVAGVAAVLLVAAGGLYFVSRDNGIGGPATASPTAAPTFSPAAAPTPTLTTITTPTLLAGGSLQPGRYFTDIQGYRYTFTIPVTGWVAEDGSTLHFGSLTNNPPDEGYLAMWGELPTLFSNACQWIGTTITPGPSVDDLANAIAGLSGFQTSTPAGVTVSGYQGKRLQVTVPSDVNFASCQNAQYHLWDGRWYQSLGQVDDIRILDLSGQRQHFFTSYLPATSQETRTQLEQVAQSLEIAPAPPASASATP